MPGYKLPRECVRDGGGVFPRYVCPECNLLLKEAVQTATCGHLLCKSCIDELLEQQAAALCPQCGEPLQQGGPVYHLDIFVQKVISDLDVICPFSQHGCIWEGKLNRYDQHVSLHCAYRPPSLCQNFDLPAAVLPFIATASRPSSPMTTERREFCSVCCEAVRVCELETHKENCMLLHQGKQCPFYPFSCPNESYMDSCELYEHMHECHNS